MRVRVQVRNGRLAMVANLGFWTQAAVTKKSLIENINDHLADPGHNNGARWAPACHVRAAGAGPAVCLPLGHHLCWAA